MEIQNRSICKFTEWAAIVESARPDRFIMPFVTEAEAIAAFRPGDEVYRLADGYAILREYAPSVPGPLIVGQDYPVLDDDGLTFGVSEEEAIAFGHRAAFVFDY